MNSKIIQTAVLLLLFPTHGFAWWPSPSPEPSPTPDTPVTSSPIRDCPDQKGKMRYVEEGDLLCDCSSIHVDTCTGEQIDGSSKTTQYSGYGNYIGEEDRDQFCEENYTLEPYTGPNPTNTTDPTGQSCSVSSFTRCYARVVESVDEACAEAHALADVPECGEGCIEEGVFIDNMDKDATPGPIDNLFNLEFPHCGIQLMRECY